MESGLRKGYRGGARRSSKVGVPEFPEGYRGGAERSSNVAVPERAETRLGAEMQRLSSGKPAAERPPPSSLGSLRLYCKRMLTGNAQERPW